MSPDPAVDSLPLPEPESPSPGELDTDSEPLLEPLESESEVLPSMDVVLDELESASLSVLSVVSVDESTPG